MNIAIIGYGKMGKEIETIALERGHSITHRLDSNSDIESMDFSQTEMAIEFTKPDLAIKHIDFCLNHNLPLVIGTTGWNDELGTVTKKVKEINGSLLHASNFSVGVNIFFELNRKLAELMSPQEAYKVSMTEVHHLQKLDAPSGTAISLAEDIISKSDYEHWNCIEGNEGVNSDQSKTFNILARREPEVPGTHVVKYSSSIDEIEIKHEAKNRKGFALGAVLAAEWLHGKKGVFTMKNVLNLT